MKSILKKSISEIGGWNWKGDIPTQLVRACKLSLLVRACSSFNMVLKQILKGMVVESNC